MFVCCGTIVLCYVSIYEHGHDNVVRRFCGNIDHGIVGEPISTTHTIMRVHFYTQAQRDQRDRYLDVCVELITLATPAVFTLPSVLEIVRRHG